MEDASDDKLTPVPPLFIGGMSPSYEDEDESPQPTSRNEAFVDDEATENPEETPEASLDPPQEVAMGSRITVKPSDDDTSEDKVDDEAETEKQEEEKDEGENKEDEQQQEEKQDEEPKKKKKKKKKKSSPTLD